MKAVAQLNTLTLKQPGSYRTSHSTSFPSEIRRQSVVESCCAKTQYVCRWLRIFNVKESDLTTNNYSKTTT